MNKGPINIFLIALILGFFLTFIAGWVGVIFFPAYGLFALIIAFSSNSITGFILGLSLPAIGGVMVGSWIITLIILPALAVTLRNKPSVLYALSPLIGCLFGAGVIITGLLIQHKDIGSSPLLYTMAGALSGLVVGAIFGKGMYRYIRNSSLADDPVFKRDIPIE